MFVLTVDAVDPIQVDLEPNGKIHLTIELSGSSSEGRVYPNQGNYSFPCYFYFRLRKFKYPFFIRTPKSRNV